MGNWGYFTLLYGSYEPYVESFFIGRMRVREPAKAHVGNWGVYLPRAEFFIMDALQEDSILPQLKGDMLHLCFLNFGSVWGVHEKTSSEKMSSITFTFVPTK